MKLKVKSMLRYAAVALTSAAITLIVVSALSGGNGWKMKTIIDNYYVDEVDEKKLEEGARVGMMEALGDEHSFYITEEMGLDAYTEGAMGEYGGVGILVMEDKETKLVRVVSVFPDTPADNAGMKKDDLIVGVNGEDVHGQAMDVVVSKTKGKSGEEVRISVLRGEETVELTMTREKIKAVSVNSEMLENGIAYVNVSSFDMDTDEEINNAIREMENVKGVVLDLRDNPGGVLQTAVRTADLFLDKGKTVVVAKYKNGEQKFMTENEKTFDLPIAVLVNENSASASEIFAAAIKENKRGTLVGQNTYGKGTIQRIFPMSGDTGVYMTIGRFYSPEDNVINKVGVAPDVEVESDGLFQKYNSMIMPVERDAQLKKAVEVLEQQ